MLNVTLLLNVLKSPRNQSSPHINSDVQTTTTTSSSYQFDAGDYRLIQYLNPQFTAQIVAECPSYKQNQIRFLLYSR